MNKKFIYTLILLTFIFSSNTLTAQLEVAPNSSAEEIIQTLLGDGVEVTGVNLNCPEGASGLFDAEFTNLDLGSGVLLTSGSVDNAVGPNETSGAGTSNNTNGDTDLDDLIPGFTTNDACVLEISFIPYGDTLSFNYVFGSEEYAGFVCSTFNDVFGFFISGGPEYPEPTNIALVPDSDLPVSINNVNIGIPDGATEPCNLDNTEYYVDNGSGIVTLPNSTIQYDGFTVVLPAVAAVTACEEYTIKLAVADAGDTVLDSGVFIEAGSFSVNSFFVEATTTLTSIEGFDYTIEECVDGIITFSRNFVNNSPVTIDFELGGTAENGIDYEFIDSFITIPPNEESIDLVIETIDDGIDEEDEIVTISISNELGCDTVLVQEVVLSIVDPEELSTSGDVEILFGQSTQLNADGGGLSYFWSPAESLDDFTSATPVASPLETTTYTVTSVLGDCFYQEELTVTVLPFECDSDAGSFINTEQIMVCSGGSFSIDVSDYMTAEVDTFDSAIMIHTIGDDTIGEVLAISTDDSPTFDLSEIEGITPNTIYYVSRVIDLQDDGNVDPFGVCVDVAIGPELVMIAPITIDTDFDCDNNTGTFILTFSINGGLPSFDGSNYTLSGDANASLIAGGSVTLPYITNSSAFLNVADDLGCSNSYSGGPFECIKSTAIELISFRGVEHENGNLLLWQTASEVNTNEFILERSVNGVDFSSITSVTPKGNASFGATYEYLDANIESSFYYRLVDIDIDGKRNVSEIIFIQRLNTNSTNIYPNPVENELNISTQLNVDQLIDVEIFDLSGRLIKQFNLEGLSGENTFLINTQDLVSGIYFIEISSLESSTSFKLVKE